ncbi:hypothetical protein V502_00983 [Pseudogymnoascus sp. VKM F-4520 (FW-2644)]|nr:hypothetical protein V502_00983 [Pseudogymnoascus sp. VKM F-4520 (FW-2644)]
MSLTIERCGGGGRRCPGVGGLRGATEATTNRGLPSKWNRCFSGRQDTSGTAMQSFQLWAFGTAEPQRVTQRTHQRKTERNNRRLERRIVKALLQSVVKEDLVEGDM